MEELKNKFLTYLDLEKKYSKYTSKNYEVDLAKFTIFINRSKIDYLKIEYQDISNYIIFLRKSGYKPASINRNLSALRSFYNYLIMENIIKVNPIDLIKSVKTEKRLPNYFKYDDFEKMLKAADGNTALDKRNILILEMLLATGLRVSELADIKISNININEHEIKVMGKGKKERIVFFGKIAEEKLRNYLNDSRVCLLKDKTSEYLFINNHGKKITDRGIRLIIEKIIQKAAITTKVSPHTFRHSFATMLLNNGCNIKSVQELLGHANLNTTSIYTHLTNEEVRKAFLSGHPRAKK